MDSHRFSKNDADNSESAAHPKGKTRSGNCPSVPGCSGEQSGHHAGVKEEGERADHHRSSFDRGVIASVPEYRQAQGRQGDGWGRTEKSGKASRLNGIGEQGKKRNNEASDDKPKQDFHCETTLLLVGMAARTWGL
jgi:hypothetical protein